MHLNLALRDPLVPDAEIDPALDGTALGGRADGGPWTRFGPVARIDWTERGLIVCGDGDYDPGPLLELAEAASWPVLAEPSSNATDRRAGAVGLSVPDRRRRLHGRRTGPT